MFGELKYKRLLPRGYQLRLTRPAHGGLIFIEFSILHTGEGFNAFFARDWETQIRSIKLHCDRRIDPDAGVIFSRFLIFHAEKLCVKSWKHTDRKNFAHNLYDPACTLYCIHLSARLTHFWQ